MSFNQASVSQQSSSCRSFTISQDAPGARLVFDPPLHSKELAEAIHNYIPGPASLQDKQGQVSMEFYAWRNTTGQEGPASYFHDATPAMEFNSFSSADLSSDQSVPSLSRESSSGSSEANKTLSASARRNRNKVVKKAAAKAVSSGTRLPGFSIMTKDGVDITDLAPRGPKTKEQREHAAMMRKLKACPACKKKKQRCNPSHHAEFNQSSPDSSAVNSQAPTPATSSASDNSPFQGHSQMHFAQTGQHFGGTIPPTPKAALTPSDFSPYSSFETLASNQYTLDSADLNMGMDFSDPSLFDSSMPFTGFEPTANAFVDDSLFDFNRYGNYQGDFDASLFANAPSHHLAGSVMTHSPQDLAQSVTSSASLRGGQFDDFTPAWDTGSTPFLPADGSPLQSPEEFGIQADFSRVSSQNSLSQDSYSSNSSLDPQPGSFFGDYSSSSSSSAEMMTPPSMSSSSSSQGFLTSEGGSFSMIPQDPLDMYSPSSSMSRQNSMAQSFARPSQSGALQSQQLGIAGSPLQPSSAESQTASYSQGGSSILGSGVQQVVHQGELQLAGTADSAVASGQHRMASVIQSSWGAEDTGSLQSNVTSTGVLTSADKQSTSTGRVSSADKQSSTSLDSATLEGLQRQLMVLDQQNMMARQESRDADLRSSQAVKPREQQSSSPDVIPQPPSRPFRFRQVEDSSFTDSSMNSTPIIHDESSTGNEVLHERLGANEVALLHQTLRQSTTLVEPLDRRLLLQEARAGPDALSRSSYSQPRLHSAVEVVSEERRIPNTQATVAAPTNVENVVATGKVSRRTEVHESSAIIPERSQLSESSPVVIVQQKPSHSGVALDTMVRDTCLGLIGLMILTGFLLAGPTLGFKSLDLLLLPLMLITLCHRTFPANFMQITPSLDSNRKQKTKNFNILSGLRYSWLTPQSHAAHPLPLAKACSSVGLKSLASSRILI